MIKSRKCPQRYFSALVRPGMPTGSPLAPATIDHHLQEITMTTYQVTLQTQRRLLIREAMLVLPYFPPASVNFPRSVTDRASPFQSLPVGRTGIGTRAQSCHPASLGVTDPYVHTSLSQEFLVNRRTKNMNKII